MTPRTAACLLLVALPLAGCLSTSQPQALGPAGVELPLLGDPLILDHDHSDVAAHALATPNLQALAHLAWDPELLGRWPARAYGEIDAKGTTAFIAALWSGFAIVDIADPAKPATLSYTPIPPAYVADIKAAEEGRLVVLGLQGGHGLNALGVPVPALPVRPPARPGFTGLQAWDASDPAQPRLVGAAWVDGGCHMVSVLEQEGYTYVYCAPNDNTVRIFLAERQGAAVAFRPVSAWSPGDLSERLLYKASPTRAQFTHDMTVQRDPLTGDPVMFVSFWDLGVHVVDVKDPANPALLGRWAGEDATLWGGKIHTAMAALAGGKRVVVAIPEYADIPAMFVLDATDYGAMRLLGEWTAHPDGDYGEDPRIFSTHNFQVVDQKVYMAMYHGGVWVLDIRDPAAPRAVAYFLPTGEPGPNVFRPGEPGPVPDTWDVVVANGHVFAVDIPTGLHVLHLEGDPVGDAYDSFA